MSFLTPLFLLLGLLAIPILLMYMLKLRRKEVAVSSNMLWQMVLRDRQANTPWQKLKRNLLLLLQLIILTLLVLALARPSMPVPAVASGSVIVLLDGSASMNAVDVEPTRFEAAKTAVRGIIQNLETVSQMSLILAARQPTVLASKESDPSALLDALEPVQPTNGSVDWAAAFALAGGAVSAGMEGDEVTIVIVSDGGLPIEDLPPLPGEVRYVPIGESSANLGITAFAASPAPHGLELFIRVENFGEVEGSAVLSLYSNDTLFHSEAISVPAQSSRSVILPDLADQAAVFRAALSFSETGGPVDHFSLDDNAFTAYQPPQQRRVLLVTGSPDGNIFLQQVLASIPGITPYRALRGENGEVQIPAGETFDLYVLDGYMPADLPPGDLLLIDPPSSELFQVSGTYTVTGRIETQESPLTRYVDMGGVHINRARQVELPVWAQSLIRTEDGPLVFAGESGSRRIAVLTFDLHDSDLPLQVAFPVLFSNLIGYLTPSLAFEAPATLGPGDVISILPDPGVEQVAVVSPGGSVHSYTPSESAILYDRTAELGLYAVNLIRENEQSAEFFAVNLFERAESDIRPVEMIQVGRSQVPAAPFNELSHKEFWPWLAAAGLAVLLLEWSLYHRSLSVKTLWDRLSINFGNRQNR